MDKKIWMLIIVILVILVGIGIFFYTSKNTNNAKNSTNEENTSEYETNRVSINNPNGINNTNISTTDNSISEENVTKKTVPEESSNTVEITQNATLNEVTEEELSSFSTKIYSTDSARQNNINITCAALDGTTVSNGETFSFCSTIGPATTAKGYEKADIFDANGNKKKGLGGGNCQISTTLYNAVLPVTSLNVSERHKHSNYVPYIEKGKDAAVAYGSYDLKFVNNTGNDIKIKADSNGKSVDISICTLK